MSNNLEEKTYTYLENFKKEQTTFKKLICVFNFVEFINSNKEIKSTISPILKRVNKNIKAIREKKYESTTLADIGFSNEGIRIEDIIWTMYVPLFDVHAEMEDYRKTTNKIKKEKILEYLEREIMIGKGTELLEKVLNAITMYIISELSKKDFDSGRNLEDRIYFNDKQSILHILGTNVKIARQEKITVEHNILNFLFTKEKENLSQGIYFREIHDELYADEDYKWNKIHNALTAINNKIIEDTKTKIDDFMEYNTGKTAIIKVNPKYQKYIM